MKKEKIKLPELYKEYYCYDDGKHCKSRQYKVLITNIIKYNEAPEFLRDIFKEATDEYHWLYRSTDYFIYSLSYEEEIPKLEIFASTIDNKWFGLGEIMNDCGEYKVDNIFCSGELDIDNSITNKLNCID